MTSPRQPTEKGLARRQLGVSGETAVVQWYVENGFEFVERNWRCREGEIDVIVRNGPVLVFCEVKTRSSTRFGTPLEAVTYAKQRRLRMLAVKWLAEKHLSGMTTIRFDVASVMGAEITVVQNAF